MDIENYTIIGNCIQHIGLFVQTKALRTGKCTWKGNTQNAFRVSKYNITPASTVKNGTNNKKIKNTLRTTLQNMLRGLRYNKNKANL